MGDPTDMDELMRALGDAEQAAQDLAGLQDRYVDATPLERAELIRALRLTATTHRTVTWRCDLMRANLESSPVT
jgi:hypothetical protein